MLSMRSATISTGPSADFARKYLIGRSRLRADGSFAVLCHKSKRSVDVENCPDVTSQQPAPNFRFVDRPETLGLLGDQIDNPGNRQVLAHGKTNLTVDYMTRRSA